MLHTANDTQNMAMRQVCHLLKMTLKKWHTANDTQNMAMRQVCHLLKMTLKNMAM